MSYFVRGIYLPVHLRIGSQYWKCRLSTKEQHHWVQTPYASIMCGMLRPTKAFASTETRFIADARFRQIAFQRLLFSRRSVDLNISGGCMFKYFHKPVAMFAPGLSIIFLPCFYPLACLYLQNNLANI